ncbi:serine/threonine-protein phosphatase [Streptomyces sp. S07_1.15]|uniref:ATP-binding SpoIIE family protein phosphatase n=1 Tax=Streptomyces sp. S07_1.15 TaxID=2873925 RepID=UPI001D14A3A6|nr:ATP-binding SpoIIE family protein phosphatase [Streptomyces sp. S07_1.15]MCC3651963.1 serine/threonine-protein phosphatase [Streptomyces sp. S07_1.15]
MTEYPTSNDGRQAATQPGHAPAGAAAPGQEPAGRPRPAARRAGDRDGASAAARRSRPRPRGDGTDGDPEPPPAEADPDDKGRGARPAPRRSGGEQPEDPRTAMARPGGRARGTAAARTGREEGRDAAANAARGGRPRGATVAVGMAATRKGDLPQDSTAADREAAAAAARRNRPGGRSRRPAAAGPESAPQPPAQRTETHERADAAGGPGGDGGVVLTAAEMAARHQRDGDRLRFIGAATRRIARGIDLDEIVLGLCRATVPTFADVILVYLRDPLPVGDERPVDPFVLRLRRSDRLPPGRGGSTGGMTASGTERGTTAGEHTDRTERTQRTGREEREGRPEGAAEPDPVRPPGSAAGPGLLPAVKLAEVAPGGPLAEVLRGVRPVFGDSEAAVDAVPELLGPDYPVPPGRRAVLAPLRGRRRVIGAAVFLRLTDRPAFEADDLLVAAQLATHTALGVDKAVLYGREAYIADALQRSMLPDSLPQPTGVRLASRYLPAAETARVGGDWYDAIPLPGSRVALVVGDVMGHSMTSAAIMGQLRTTAQTLAQLDLPPQEVLHHLDEQAQRLGSDRMATCIYAVYDPVAHRIVVANAGHPPPVLLHLGGRAEVLRVPPGAPIGVGGVDFEAVELDAPAGATLLLYTDGLVESRLRDVWTGIEQLREKLVATARLTGPDHPPPLEPLCDEVLDMLGPGDRDDDIALLAARFDGIPPSDVAYWFLDPQERAPSKARRLARRALARWGLEELSDSVELLVSEIVTNAVRYAERPITLRLLRTDVLRCEVGDDVPQLPRLRQARPSDEGGRGLYLVNKVARRWGATRLSTGKVVWFELPFTNGG